MSLTFSSLSLLKIGSVFTFIAPSKNAKKVLYVQNQSLLCESTINYTIEY